MYCVDMNFVLCRYISHEAKVVTTYMKMKQISDVTALTLYSTLLEVLSEFGVDPRKVMGFGSDGASVMTGSENGVAARLRKDNPHAVAVHCICHRLHLAVSQVCKGIPAMQVRQTLNYVTASLPQIHNSAYNVNLLVFFPLGCDTDHFECVSPYPAFSQPTAGFQGHGRASRS